MPPPLRLFYAGWADHVHLERWAGYFARTGHQVGVFSFSEMGNYPSNVIQARIRFQKRRALLRKAHLRWLISHFRPQIVHVHWAPFAEDVIDVWSGPLMITAWGSDIYRFSEQPVTTQNNVRKAFERADAITCDSEDLAAAIVRLAPNSVTRISVIQWGVDTNAFSPAVDCQALARNLNVVGRPIIFSARNFLPLYNQDVVLRAFALLHEAIPEAILIMKNYNGQPDYVAEMRQLITELGITESVRIIDEIPYDQMPRLYAMAQATVSVPTSDATPMALLEAMACGSVPIFSDLPSLREWICPNKNGYLVDSRDFVQLAAILKDTLADPTKRSQISSFNLQEIEKRASQDFWMSKAESIYREILAVHRAS